MGKVDLLQPRLTDITRIQLLALLYLHSIYSQSPHCGPQQLQTLTISTSGLAEENKGLCSEIHSNLMAVARDGYECSPTQNCKCTYNLFIAHQFSLVFVCLMCSPRQLFFQCGPETPKGWTPLV